MKIDVIICAYNAHKYIKKAINSIIKQSIIDKIKITIVDDGSNYDYEDIISNYSENIKLITLKKNKGIGSARQVGLKNTFNEYVMFIDSDDEFYSDTAVEKLYNVISKNNDVDVVEGKINSTSGIIENPFTYLHGKMYRRSFIDKNNIDFLDLKISEDTAFNLAISASGANRKQIEDIIYFYNKNIKDSITDTITNRVEILKSVLIACDYAYKKTKDYNVFINSITNIYEQFINNFINKKNFKTENDLIIYAKLCKNFYKKYKKYIINTDYIKAYKNVFEVF